VKTNLRTRAFLLCFVPFAVLLLSSFWMVRHLVDSAVRNGLRAALHERQVALATVHAEGALHNSRFLRVAGENTALKAGMVLLRAYPDNDNARRTVEDQLLELGERMGFDLMVVSGPDGIPMVGVLRQSQSPADRGRLVPLPQAKLEAKHAGMQLLDGRLLEVASIGVDQGEEHIGSLALGEFVNLSSLTTPVVLVHNRQVVLSNISNVLVSGMKTALAACAAPECDLRVAGHDWISLPMESYGDGYTLLSLEDVDKATAPIEARLNVLFATLGLAAVLAALLSSVGSSRSIARPIAAVVTHLRNAVSTGKLPQLEQQTSSILEIRELAEIYNRAAISVRDSGFRLESAYLEFVGSLASALDARDPYTAGHSWRVSQLSCAVASALALAPDHIQRIRIGALLHDIGKIGIADSVLQKPGRLTTEEFALVKQHPVIGRRILEGVQGFAPFLAAVELHHENWNGTGYPLGQRGEETPIDARIIHVADAYDAMTTERSYRRGICEASAVDELQRQAGTQFDPAIVAAFVAMPRQNSEPPPFQMRSSSANISLTSMRIGVSETCSSPAFTSSSAAPV
jgi:HD-GYP domain-containing protein (c-di-GMP phosphodiesterase class II)